MSELRGRWYDFRGTKLAVTYHPAFLLRDPRQKKETWKDLQMVMKELGPEGAGEGPGIASHGWGSLSVRIRCTGSPEAGDILGSFCPDAERWH